MADPELEELRKQRLAELQSQFKVGMNFFKIRYLKFIYFREMIQTRLKKNKLKLKKTRKIQFSLKYWINQPEQDVSTV